MAHTVEQAVVVRYDPDQAPPISYHREHELLVVTFGPEPSGVDHLAMVLRREVDPNAGASPEQRREVADAYERGFAEGVAHAKAGGQR